MFLPAGTSSPVASTKICSLSISPKRFETESHNASWWLICRIGGAVYAPRRGDGTLGESVPGVATVVMPGFTVAHGEIANVEIGVEVKILAKAMLKQLARVENDLRDQVKQFQTHANNPVCIGIVGINHAESYVGYEGERVYKTDGTSRRHPIQEAEQAERRLSDAVATRFDELLFMRYRATNEAPYPFEWVDHVNTTIDYGAALVRISNAYDIRFS